VLPPRASKGIDGELANARAAVVRDAPGTARIDHLEPVGIADRWASTDFAELEVDFVEIATYG
jgi:hypothetical protein